MDTHADYGEKGRSAGPLAAVILLAAAFLLLSGLEFEMLRALV